MKKLLIAITILASLGAYTALIQNTVDNRWIMARIDEELKGDPNIQTKRQTLHSQFKRQFAIPEKL